jgi:CheY-like chemotaxis protein
LPGPDSGPPVDGRGARKLLILVVERDPHVRELEAHFLNRAGFAVEFAVDGQAALEQAQRLVPDIVITEILVPKLDGLALCRQLKSDPTTRQMRVVVFSMLSARQRAREAGADAFLMKPLAEHRLLTVVQGMLDDQHGPEGEHS